MDNIEKKKTNNTPENRSSEKEVFIRPTNLAETFFPGYKKLSDEAREMQAILAEKYKKTGESFVEKIKDWREENSDASLEDAIRALFEKEE